MPCNVPPPVGTAGAEAIGAAGAAAVAAASAVSCAVGWGLGSGTPSAVSISRTHCAGSAGSAARYWPTISFAFAFVQPLSCRSSTASRRAICARNSATSELVPVSASGAAGVVGLGVPLSGPLADRRCSACTEFREISWTCGVRMLRTFDAKSSADGAAGAAGAGSGVTTGAGSAGAAGAPPPPSVGASPSMLQTRLLSGCRTFKGFSWQDANSYRLRAVIRSAGSGTLRIPQRPFTRAVSLRW